MMLDATDSARYPDLVMKALSSWYESLHPSILAGMLSILALALFGGLWFVLLFTAQPECLGALEAAAKTLKGLLSLEFWFYVPMMVSLVVCILCTILFFAKSMRTAYALLGLHLLCAVYLYDWLFVLDLALPLFVASKAIQSSGNIGA